MQKRIVIHNKKKYIVNVVGWEDGIWMEPTASTTPTPPSFTSASVPGMYAWYSADTGLYSHNISGSAVTVSGSNVLRWEDQSGYNHHLAQSNATNAPVLNTNIINSNPAIRFDGINDHFTTTLSAMQAQPNTYFFVMKWYNTAAYQIVMDGNSTFRNFFAQYPAGSWDMYAGTGDVNIGAVNSSYNIVFLEFNGASSKYGFNTTGSTTVGTTPGSLAQSTLTIGCHYNINTFANMDLCEMMMFTGSMTPTNRATVVNYLSTKYNITVT